MKIGLVGYQGSGKSTLFQWLTGQRPDPSMAHTTQSAMAAVRDPRIAELRRIYQPKRTTFAALELVDTPGLSRSHEESAAKLAMIREAGCLILIAAAFDGGDPAADLANFQDDLLIADLAIVAGRIERLREFVKKPRPDRVQLQHELELLAPVHEALDRGEALRDLDLSPKQQQAIRSFQLLTEKPRLAILNIADDDKDPQRFASLGLDPSRWAAVSLALQFELDCMTPDERDEFCREMDVAVYDRDALLRTIMDVSQQMLFFTAGPKEVHSWMIPQNSTAVDAAAAIHTDLAHGFIRAEVMSCDDLIRLGGEREVKAHNLARQEPKSYVVQEGDVLYIRHA